MMFETTEHLHEDHARKRNGTVGLKRSHNDGAGTRRIDRTNTRWISRWTTRGSYDDIATAIDAAIETLESKVAAVSE